MITFEVICADTCNMSPGLSVGTRYTHNLLSSSAYTFLLESRQARQTIQPDPKPFSTPTGLGCLVLSPTSHNQLHTMVGHLVEGNMAENMVKWRNKDMFFKGRIGKMKICQLLIFASFSSNSIKYNLIFLFLHVHVRLIIMLRV